MDSIAVNCLRKVHSVMVSSVNALWNFINIISHVLFNSAIFCLLVFYLSVFTNLNRTDSELFVIPSL